MKVELNLNELKKSSKQISSMIKSETISVSGVTIDLANDDMINMASGMISMGMASDVSLNLHKLADVPLAELTVLVDSKILSNGAEGKSDTIAKSIMIAAQDANAKASRESAFSALFPDDTSSAVINDFIKAIGVDFRTHIELPKDESFRLHLNFAGKFHFEMVERMEVKPDIVVVDDLADDVSDEDRSKALAEHQAKLDAAKKKEKSEIQKTAKYTSQLGADDYFGVMEPKLITQMTQLGINGRKERKASTGGRAKFPVDVELIDKCAALTDYAKPEKGRVATNVYTVTVIRQRQKDFGKDADGKLVPASKAGTLDQALIVETLKSNFPEIFKTS
tara:strand:- start:93 stop:1100 length:1008 start_codon:yes stop_codon:yes gene_type:complete